MLPNNVLDYMEVKRMNVLAKREGGCDSVREVGSLKCCGQKVTSGDLPWKGSVGFAFGPK